MATEKVKANRLQKVRDQSGETAVIRGALEAQTKKRDNAIRSALDAGLSIREVAAAAGLSAQQVLNIKSADPSGTRYNERTGEAR